MSQHERACSTARCKGSCRDPLALVPFCLYCRLERLLRDVYGRARSGKVPA